MAAYGREALRRFREQQARPPEQRQPQSLDQIPPDAPMDDATMTAWDGRRWRDIKWWTIERAFASAKTEEPKT